MELGEKAAWKYSASMKPYSYWLSLGRGNAYAEAMTDFQDQFTLAVNGMRSGHFSDVIFNCPSQINDSIIFHDAALLPHWHEVALALEINSKTLRSTDSRKDEENSFEHLGLSAEMISSLPRGLKEIMGAGISSGNQLVMDSVELRREVLDIIGLPLQLNPFETIWLERNRLDRHGILFVIDLLKQNSYMQSFIFIDNTIQTNEDFELMTHLVCNHPSLKKLRFERCVGRNISSTKINSLIPACKGLKSLTLNGNHIQTDGSSVIADCLATNPPLQKLNLLNNKFNDDDAELIAQALKTNTNLWKLNLQRNEIGHCGCSALFKAIFNSDSLSSICSSNHTCDVSVSRCKIPCINGEIYGGERGALEAKKFALIAPPNDQGVKLLILNEVPLKLMHMVLEFIQKYPKGTSEEYVEELLQCEAMLESGVLVDEEEEEQEEQEEGSDGEYSFSKDEYDRQEAEAIKLHEIKSLSALMSVVKGVVVPMVFSA